MVTPREARDDQDVDARIAELERAQAQIRALMPRGAGSHYRNILEGHPHRLTRLADVTGAPGAGQVLAWNASDKVWECKSPAEVLAILSGEAAANFAMNSKKFTSLAAGSGAGDSVRYEQAIKSGDAAGGDLGGTYPNPTVDDGADSTALHDNVAAEINAIAEKGTPVDADLLIIEDSAASNAKKKVQVGNLPGGDGGDDHAPVGALYPGVLSVGVKPPQVPYLGTGFTATRLYCRVSVAPDGADIIVSIRQNGAEIDTVTIADGTQTGETACNDAISDEDYFDIEIDQVGTNPNEGSDLVWMVAP